MGNLIRFEWYRLRKNWVFLALEVAAVLAITISSIGRWNPTYGMARTVMLAQDSLTLFGSILVCYYFCADFESRAYLYPVASGWPRNRILLCRLVFCYGNLTLTGMVSTLLILFLCLPSAVTTAPLETIKWMAFRILTDWGLLSTPVLASMLLRQTIPTMTIGALYAFIVICVAIPYEQYIIWVLLTALAMILLTVIISVFLFCRAELR